MSPLVFAHYFTAYPISFDNTRPRSLGGTGDYYDNGYLNPAGENNAHAYCAGMLRDRPQGRVPFTQAQMTGTDFWALDMVTEVGNAKAAGLDGFCVDLLSFNTSTTPSTISNRHAALVVRLLAAAKAAGNFRVMLMPDMNAIGNITPGQMAQMCALYAKLGAFTLDDGRLVVSPFLAENWSVTTWQTFFDIMKGTYGITVAFVPCFLNYEAHYKAFASICYGFSHWGNRAASANDLKSGMARIAGAHSLGKIWMQPVSFQDHRPNQAMYWEPRNSENFLATWAIAMQGKAEWVQIPTWNDYSEGAQIAPSMQHGHALTYLTNYYANYFRTGLHPAWRDALIVSHRQHWHDDKQSYVPPAGITAHPEVISPYSGAAIDRVEVLAIVSSPCTVKIKVGDAVQSFTLRRSVNALTMPLGVGTVSASLIRDGKVVSSVASPFPVTHTPYKQDMGYVTAISTESPATPAQLP